MDQAAVLVTDQIRTKKNAIARKASLLPDSLTHKFYLQKRDQQNSSVLNELSNMIFSLPPAPMLIFPGRTGLKSLQQHLRSNAKLSNVQGLEDIKRASPSPVDANDKGGPFSSWSKTPVYVISEKLGRGLDIPGVKYVVLMQVPSSAAGYTHLAGRTGRNGIPGTAISFCAPRQAPKLCIIAETLGIYMKKLPVSTDLKSVSSHIMQGGDVGCVSDSLGASASDNSTTLSNAQSLEEKTKQGSPSKDMNWSQVSSSALKRKTIAEIKKFLSFNGLPYERAMKKAELLEEVHKFLDSP